MTVRFGATIIQTLPFETLLDDVRFVESLGLENAWVIDQFGIDEAPDATLLETWTTLAAIATGTERIRLGSMVTNAAMRHPALLAKTILTVDQISRGRLDTAIGGGYHSAEHAALGIDFLDARGRSERLRETVEVLDRALRGETVSYDGGHVRLTDATFRPHPTQHPRPPLWVAAQARRSLRVAVRFGQAMVTLGEENGPIERSLPAFAARMELADELCADEGRDPTSLRRCYFAGWADEPIFASPDATADVIGRYVEAGATDFTFYLQNPAEPRFDELVAAHRMATRDQLEHVASAVFPQFRAAAPD